MSASRVDECEDEHPTGSTGRGFLPEQRDGKPPEAGDVEAGAKERLVDRGLGWKVFEERKFGDGLLRWYLLYGEDVHAARSA